MLIDSLGIGGAETHVETLIRELSALGHNVCIMSSGGIIADRMKKMGIENVYLPPITQGKNLNLPNLLHYLKNLQIIRCI